MGQRFAGPNKLEACLRANGRHGPGVAHASPKNKKIVGPKDCSRDSSDEGPLLLKKKWEEPPGAEAGCR